MTATRALVLLMTTLLVAGCGSNAATATAPAATEAAPLVVGAPRNILIAGDPQPLPDWLLEEMATAPR